MPERQNVINVLNDFIASYDYVDESFWEAFEISDFNIRDKIENNTAGYIADYLLNGNYLENVRSFSSGMLKRMLITIPNENCENLEEITALETCCRNLELLA